eukprot:GHVU01012527.1.p1 GENE.GHVU01012527.1~~GHVU01012527.1.p1  ORF type:complete len:493 (+),score=41.59 GHVU01012527.1:283-1761(+)
MPKSLYVFMDVQIGSKAGGRIVLELFSDTTPKTAENFRQLCTGEAGRSRTSGKRLHYEGCQFFRVVPGFVIQSGDFECNNGDGGESIYPEKKFRDENFNRRHAQAGVLSMANTGRHSNGSQFFITLKRAPQLDTKHVVFGQVKGGMEVIRAIEKVPIDMNNKPRVPIVVVACGQIDAPAFNSSDPYHPIRKQINDLMESTDGSGKAQDNTQKAEITMKVALARKGLEGLPGMYRRQTCLARFALSVFVFEAGGAKASGRVALRLLRVSRFQTATTAQRSPLSDSFPLRCLRVSLVSAAIATAIATPTAAVIATPTTVVIANLCGCCYCHHLHCCRSVEPARDAERQLEESLLDSNDMVVRAVADGEFKNDRERKLHELQMKINQAKTLNSKEVSFMLKQEEDSCYSGIREFEQQARVHEFRIGARYDHIIIYFLLFDRSLPFRLQTHVVSSLWVRLCVCVCVWDCVCVYERLCVSLKPCNIILFGSSFVIKS